MSRLTHTVEIKSPLGFHARPAASLAKLLMGFRSTVWISYGDEIADARSIFSLLALAATCGAVLTLIIDGEDAEETLKKLVAFFDHPSSPI